MLTSCIGSGGGSDDDNTGPLDLIADGSVGAYPLDANPLATYYKGSIGGIVGAVSEFKSGQNSMIIWGEGSTLNWGTLEKIYSSAQLENPGTITTIQSVDENKIVFGTDIGVGIAEIDSNQSLAITFFMGLEHGLVTSSEDGYGNVYAINSIGQLLRMTVEQIEAGETIDLLVETTSWVKDEQWYPVEVEAYKNKLAVILQNTGPLPTLPLGREPVESILKQISTGSTKRKIVLVGDDKTIKRPAKSIRPEFIPTGVSISGTSMVVVGFAYDKNAASLYVEKCSGSADKIDCLWEKALEGDLTTYQSNNADVFSGRVFEIDLPSRDILKTKDIMISDFAYSPTPPFIFRPEISGSSVYVRGTSFFQVLKEDPDDEETWFTQDEFGKIGWGDVAIGWPRSMVAGFQDGLASAVLKQEFEDAPAYSNLQYVSLAGEAQIIDSGSASPIIVGGGISKLLVIEKREESGGDLYLVNSNERSIISPNEPQTNFWYITNAAYSGQLVAAVCYEGDTPTGHSYNYLLFSQEGTDSSTQERTTIERFKSSGGGTSTMPFYNFPIIKSSDTAGERDKKQGVAAMQWGMAYTLHILFHGYEDGIHYFRAARYKRDNGTLKQDIIAGIDPLQRGGDESFKPKILSISDDNEKLYFSAADGIYYFNYNPQGNEISFGRLFESDISSVEAISTNGDSIALIEGSDLKIRQFENINIQFKRIIGSSSGATVALLQNRVVVSTPTNSAQPISVYTLTQTLTQLVTSNRAASSVVGLPGIQNRAFFITPHGIIEKYDFEN